MQREQGNGGYSQALLLGQSASYLVEMGACKPPDPVAHALGTIPSQTMSQKKDALTRLLLSDVWFQAMRSVINTGAISKL